MSEEVLSKAELLKAIRSERKQIEDCIFQLSEEQMVTPVVENGWTIKDILVHITNWEQLAMDRIQSALSGDPLKYPLINNDADVDDFNAKIYADNKDQPLQNVLKSAQASYQAFFALIESLDEDFIQKNLPFDWGNTLSVFRVISSNTHWHYDEHRADIEKWLAK